MAVVDIEKYKRNKGKTKKKMILRIALFSLFIFFVTIAIVLYTPFFKISEIMLQDNFIVSNDEIDESLLNVYDANIFFVDEEEIKTLLSDNIYIKNVNLTKDYPNKILVKITERKPAGIIVTSDGFIKVSDDGLFLSINQRINEYNLPIITGIDLYNVPGIGEPFENEQLNEIVEIINEVNPILLKEINEVNLNSEGITAYTKNRLEIRLGDKADISEKLEVLEEIINDIIGIKIDVDQVEYIDLSYKDSYIIKRKSNDMKGE